MDGGAGAGTGSGAGPGSGEGWLDAVFFALADPTRRAVVRGLLTRESVTATELAGGLPISRQAVSKHLAALVAAGLVASSREGRETRYRLTPEPLDAASAWLGVVEAEWDARLGRLRRAVVDRRGGDRGAGPAGG